MTYWLAAGTSDPGACTQDVGVVLVGLDACVITV